MTIIKASDGDTTMTMDGCPNCGGGNVKGENIQVRGSIITGNFTCKSCGFSQTLEPPAQRDENNKIEVVTWLGRIRRRLKF